MLPDDDKWYAFETCRGSESVLKKWFKINDIQLVHLLVVWYLVNWFNVSRSRAVLLHYIVNSASLLVHTALDVPTSLYEVQAMKISVLTRIFVGFSILPESSLQLFPTRNIPTHSQSFCHFLILYKLCTDILSLNELRNYIKFSLHVQCCISFYFLLF